MVRFAVVGCGRQGLKRIESILRRRESHGDCELSALADPRPMSRELAERYSLALVDWHQAVELRNIDWIVIATPNHLHCQIALAALACGKNVLIEKPLATNTTDASMLLAAAGAAGRHVKTGSNTRYMPNVKAASELVATGKIGEPRFLRGRIGHNGSSTSHSWFRDAARSGGGTCIDNGVHLFDLSRVFLGNAVKCSGRIITAGPTGVEEDAFAWFETAAGRVSHVQSSWRLWRGYLDIEIGGDAGCVELQTDATACMTRLVQANGGVLQEFEFLGAPNSYDAELADLLDSLRRDRAPKADGEDGLRSLAMAEAIYLSSAEGAMVAL